MSTGKILDADEQALVKTLRERAVSAPVMIVGGVDFNQVARKDFFNAVQAMAVKHGLPDGSFYYGVSETGELTVPPGFDTEYQKLCGVGK